jgi:hypothetical protein
LEAVDWRLRNRWSEEIERERERESEIEIESESERDGPAT